MKYAKHFLLCSLLTAASLQAGAACYTVYDASNRVIYSGDRPPVDMSRPIHETVGARFPGGHMIFDTDISCPAIVALTPAPVPGGTPLLTDERTARAMRVPHASLAGGIALVQAQDAVVRPGVTVLPSTKLARAPTPSRGTVITELRDPPVTVVESLDRSSAAEAARSMGAGPAPRR